MKVRDDEITEEDLQRPLAAFVKPDKREVAIHDLGDYFDVFYAIEFTVLSYWQDYPALKDRDVISAFKRLLKDFDGAKEGTLADEISKSIKAMLLYRRLEGGRDYSYGEIVSCLKFLIMIAEQHESSSGRGYLKWVKLFFEGELPITEEEILDYISKEEEIHGADN